MNERLNPSTLEECSKALNPRRELERSAIASEVIAGFLWMSLDLPDDVSLNEILTFATHLQVLARTGVAEHLLITQLNQLQREQFLLGASPERMKTLARRVLGFARP
jgi:hypothetical protein